MNQATSLLPSKKLLVGNYITPPVSVLSLCFKPVSVDSNLLQVKELGPSKEMVLGV